MEAFEKLGLSENTIKALEKKGFTEPTTIQAKVIPLLLEGKKDVVGQSQTGTGKTAGFALPILEKIKLNAKSIQAIILTPTRELAIQVAKEIDSLKGKKNVKILSVYGGSSIVSQIQALKKGVDIVVGTPGRVMDLQNRKVLKLNHIKFAVLDEADEMLNMGFVEDIEDILVNTPEDKNMLLFSATMPRQILKIAKNYMREYEFIEVEKKNVITETVEQIYYDVNAHDRVEAIRRIIDSNIDFHGIIFCNTKAAVDTLAHQLTRMNYSSAALHGDITQSQREKILQKFRNKYVKVLIATDVAARGIDVNDLTHVINFSLPQSPESYVHRIGRTGRAGKKGISITLVIPSERRKLSFVERINSCKLKKHKLPSPKKIIEDKEAQIKVIIKNIIESNKNKSSKYKNMADDLLKDNDPSEIVSAVLKYSFKSELEASNYKDISEPQPGKMSERGRSGGFRGGRPRQRSDRSGGRSRGRSSDRKRTPSNRSDRPNKSGRPERSSRSRKKRPRD
ncbi:DEAD/DEAH box helicase [archaeon]|jgi:ATP-dependent RNA helicase DeaD|nr:DEAD/DEAH box helicase [archaeon]MBT6868474.1 DEAD/DEAH box helicase [archaeon]MBT7193573.1 DEAD/DEAH box helicase [archaeon]MBT7381232.1 DEAD/DEAH box helicase [archaeon]MBT7508474.1 DEAD/DEAH box helicase [archaeon]